MDDSRCREFFLKPTEIYHRRYEALRAFFVEGQRLEETAQQFGYQESSLRSLVCRFRAQVKTNDLGPFFFNRDLDGLRAELTPAPTSSDPQAGQDLPPAATLSFRFELAARIS